MADDKKFQTIKVGEEAQEVAVSNQAKASFWGRLWDTVDYSREERRLLTKVDFSLLVFASLGYFIKNLDQSNVSSAFVSGMKEDLNMYGNELVHATSIWTAGYCVGQIPINLLLTRVSPRWVIPALELGWGICTLASYSVKTTNNLFAIRFFVGFFESGFYPAMHYVLGSWYTPRELAKRTSLFYVAGSIGTMFSGFLQSAAYTNLNGVGGLEGWRWLFIVDAIITIPVAILGFVFLPGLPWNARPTFWLSQDEIKLSQARMKAVGRKEHVPWTRAKVRSIFSTWHIYILPITYLLYNNAIAQQPMAYWLKSFNPTATHAAPVPGRTYTVSQINLLPLPATAIFVVLAMGYAWWSDALGGKRWPFIIFGCLLNIAVNASLYLMPLYTNIPSRFFLYYLTQAAGSIGALVMNWNTEITGWDNELRSLVIGAGNDFAYVVQAIAPNYIWPTVDFPAARKGHLWSISLSTILVPWVFMVIFLDTRDRKRNTLERRDSAFTDDSASAELEKSSKDLAGEGGDLPTLGSK